MTTKDLEYVINLVRQWQGLRGLTSVLKDVLLWVKCYQTVIHATETFFMKSQWMRQTSLLSYLKKLPQSSYPTETTPVSQQPSTLRQEPPQQKSVTHLKAQVMVSTF